METFRPLTPKSIIPKLPNLQTPSSITHVTAYWAKERYSTRTSRPRFSSLRNSLTHLHPKRERQVRERDRQTGGQRDRQVVRETDMYPMWFVRREISSSLRLWVDSCTRLLNFCRQTGGQTDRLLSHRLVNKRERDRLVTDRSVTDRRVNKRQVSNRQMGP